MGPLLNRDEDYYAVVIEESTGRIKGIAKIEEGVVTTGGPGARYMVPEITLRGREIPYEDIEITTLTDDFTHYAPNRGCGHALFLKRFFDTYRIERCQTCAYKGTLRGKTKFLLLIEKVIFNDPATIVIWKDGTKTVVKCGEGDVFDPEKGLALCFMKKVLGNKGNFNNIIKEWIPEDSELSESAANSIKHMAEVLRDSMSTINTALGGKAD